MAEVSWENRLLVVGHTVMDYVGPALLPSVASVRRLMSWGGFTETDWLECTRRDNVIPTRSGPPSRSDVVLARGRIAQTHYCDGRRVLLLGEQAARLVFLCRPFRWLPVPSDLTGRSGMWAAFIPHPSGLNHYYNLRARRTRAGSFVRDALWHARLLDGRVRP